MQNTEFGLELYDAISSLVALGASARGMAVMKGNAVNMPAYSATGRVYLVPAKPIMEFSPDELKGYYQGFHCVEVVVTTSWGGSLSEPSVAVHGYDRRVRWDGPTLSLENPTSEEAIKAVEALCATR